VLLDSSLLQSLNTLGTQMRVELRFIGIESGRKAN
jgi:hypothetical protein